MTDDDPRPPYTPTPEQLREFYLRVAGVSEPQPDGTRIGRAFMWRSGGLVWMLGGQTEIFRKQYLHNMVSCNEGQDILIWLHDLPDKSEAEKGVARRTVEFRHLLQSSIKGGVDEGPPLPPKARLRKAEQGAYPTIRMDNPAVAENSISHSSLFEIQKPLKTINDRYEIVETITTGGMGIVYLCVDRQTNRPYALKTFKPEYLRDRQACVLFLKEANAWIRLGNHPHIVQAHSVISSDNALHTYVVLDMVAPEPGHTASLASWVQPGGLSPERVFFIGVQVANGMKYATDQIAGLVHRDLKPANILWGTEGRARITDFGLAGIEASTIYRETSAAHESMVALGGAGTPYYMAPEQWGGDAVDCRADMYSLGCTLLELLSGQPPIAAAALEQMAAADNKDPFYPYAEAHRNGWLTPVPESLPNAAKTALQLLLMQDREQRPSSWADVEQWLRHAYYEISGHNMPSLHLSAEGFDEDKLMAAIASLRAIAGKYHQTGYFDKAIGHLEEALSQAKNLEQHFMGIAQLVSEIGLINQQLGEAYIAQGKTSKAITCLDESDNYLPNQASTRLLRGIAHYRIERTDADLTPASGPVSIGLFQTA